MKDEVLSENSVHNLHTWDKPTIDFVFLCYNEPIWSASDGFIKSSRFQSTQDGNSVWVFFLIKDKMAKCNVRNCRRFLFGMSPDVLAFKVLVFTSDFKFWIGENDY